MNVVGARAPRPRGLTPVSPDTALLARLAALEARVAELEAERRPLDPDRAVPLVEAAAMLGTSTSWLSRRENWRRVGGYSDADRRVKVPLSAITRWINAQAH